MGTHKTAIVTGASSGIGLGLTTALVEHGYRVVANSRRITEAGTVVPSSQVALVDGDIGEAETARRLVDTAVSRFGGIDLLVNNAGIFIPKPFTEYTPDDFSRLVSTNLAGFLYVTQEAVRHMKRRGAGHVVTITTTLADQPIAGVPASVPVLTKGGLNAATAALAIEFANDGVRFNAIGAGIIDTPMHKPDTHGFLKTLHPIQRIGRVSEIVDAVLYLTEATFVTGEVLHVDGGAHAGKW
ncbi:MAG: SDR family oxidoreductase [Nitrospira sp.]|uniref:3-oxoacyl-ACP reductase n=1 Tax=Nitrospira defluvii TaxID=330214 RepID=A0ABM8QSU5_9BACT|nr:SDR family oxidoreductase [Nitrospira defluvii]MCS6328747.1 SDR family oxidoreductase [Nitrospira sp.]CAE6713460.1 3-oxoacyl-ACP reductase [Nitrospira defluvii]